jgi:diguanylate cyclase (GGDEF)-like protein
LEQPPIAVVADLHMPSISGVQLCRLLRAETGTAAVPVILRGPEGRFHQFWAEQAGAAAYVAKGRMGELVRALRRAVDLAPKGDNDFFVLSSTDGLDIKDRIATHLDAALFESVIAAEVRRLGTAESFDRLVDLLSQFVSRVTNYRWMAVLRTSPLRLGIHANPDTFALALTQARAAFGVSENVEVLSIQDEDAFPTQEAPLTSARPIMFSEHCVGQFALAPCLPGQPNDSVIARTIADELGGAVRMASLVEESRQMATTDSLTVLLNRRAFLARAGDELKRSQRYGDNLSVILLDVDHFKRINDQRGHAAGDHVLVEVAKLLSGSVRGCDVVARWGGEEFVIALPSTPPKNALILAERLRCRLEAHPIVDHDGTPIPVTASFGLAAQAASDNLQSLIDRADRAMYGAKSSGRNRVHFVEHTPTPECAEHSSVREPVALALEPQ